MRSAIAFRFRSCVCACTTSTCGIGTTASNSGVLTVVGYYERRKVKPLSAAMARTRAPSLSRQSVEVLLEYQRQAAPLGRDNVGLVRAAMPDGAESREGTQGPSAA